MSRPISMRSATGDALAGWPPPVLDPAGPYAGSTNLLAWVLFTVVIILTIVQFGIARRWVYYEGDKT